MCRALEQSEKKNYVKICIQKYDLACKPRCNKALFGHVMLLTVRHICCIVLGLCALKEAVCKSPYHKFTQKSKINTRNGHSVRQCLARGGGSKELVTMCKEPLKREFEIRLQRTIRPKTPSLIRIELNKSTPN